MLLLKVWSGTSDVVGLSKAGSRATRRPPERRLRLNEVPGAFVGFHRGAAGAGD